MAKGHLRHSRCDSRRSFRTGKASFNIFDHLVFARHHYSHGVFSRAVSGFPSCYPVLNIISRYTANRQHGKALTYFLRLRRPNVLDVIREHNLFTDVKDQVLLLVEFDHELMRKREEAGETIEDGKSDAITLLVDNIHSIPVSSFETERKP